MERNLAFFQFSSTPFSLSFSFGVYSLLPNYNKGREAIFAIKNRKKGVKELYCAYCTV